MDQTLVLQGPRRLLIITQYRTLKVKLSTPWLGWTQLKTSLKRIHPKKTLHRIHPRRIGLEATKIYMQRRSWQESHRMTVSHSSRTMEIVHLTQSVDWLSIQPTTQVTLNSQPDVMTRLYLIPHSLPPLLETQRLDIKA